MINFTSKYPHHKREQKKPIIVYVGFEAEKKGNARVEKASEEEVRARAKEEENIDLFEDGGFDEDRKKKKVGDVNMEICGQEELFSNKENEEVKEETKEKGGHERTDHYKEMDEIVNHDKKTKEESISEEDMHKVKFVTSSYEFNEALNSTLTNTESVNNLILLTLNENRKLQDKDEKSNPLSLERVKTLQYLNLLRYTSDLMNGTA